MTDRAASVRHPRRVFGPRERAIFRVLWYSANILLVLSLLTSVYALDWEYSTRRYLKGFSDAIIPEAASPREKVDAILNWMAHGPSRLPSTEGVGDARNPNDTLNYAALLQVCGSATNAFLNLANSEGLSARRLLLLNSSDGLTKHVVAEVLLDGRWVIVDPAFRTTFSDPNGNLLTRAQLADPTIFRSATAIVPNYTFTYNDAIHVRVGRLRRLGRWMATILDRIVPNWDETPLVSLILERESLAALALSVALLLSLLVLRWMLRRYGEVRFGFRSMRVREQLRRATAAFLEAA